MPFLSPDSPTFPTLLIPDVRSVTLQVRTAMVERILPNMCKSHSGVDYIQVRLHCEPVRGPRPKVNMRGDSQRSITSVVEARQKLWPKKKCALHKLHAACYKTLSLAVRVHRKWQLPGEKLFLTEIPLFWPKIAAWNESNSGTDGISDSRSGTFLQLFL